MRSESARERRRRNNMKALKLLSKCSPEKLCQLTHGTVDRLCGRIPPSYQDFSEIYSLEEWWEVSDACTDFCKMCGKNDDNLEEVTKNLGELPGAHKQSMAESILSRKTDLRRALLDATCAISHSRLNDFDWQMKLVMSSDKMAGIMEPLVSVDFDVVNNNNGRKVTSVELNKQDLQTMINSLEAANRAVQQLKTT